MISPAKMLFDNIILLLFVTVVGTLSYPDKRKLNCLLSLLYPAPFIIDNCVCLVVNINTVSHIFNCGVVLFQVANDTKLQKLTFKKNFQIENWQTKNQTCLLACCCKKLLNRSLEIFLVPKTSIMGLCHNDIYDNIFQLSIIQHNTVFQYKFWSKRAILLCDKLII